MLQLDAKITVLTRNPTAFVIKCPHLAANPSIELLAGDVRDFAFPSGEFKYTIHAATEVRTNQAAEDPLEMLTTIIDGTQRTLEFAVARGTQKYLLASSGAIYGKQAQHIRHIPENYSGGPDPLNPASVYAEGKRISEQMCSLYAKRGGIECKIARCFAFVGPYLPLDSHFAIGNFIRDVMRGGPIRIEGDGTPVRSYLYAGDLACWLWTILFRAPSIQAFNVGSENAISIRDLASEAIAALNPTCEVTIAKEPVQGAPLLRYVPSTRFAQQQLHLKQSVGLRDAIRRTAAWHGFQLDSPANEAS